MTGSLATKIASDRPQNRPLQPDGDQRPIVVSMAAVTDGGCEITGTGAERDPLDRDRDTGFTVQTMT